MTKNVVEVAIENVRSKSQGPKSQGSESQGSEYPTHHAVTINFHPDRYTNNSMSVLQSIAADGVLKSQFETGTSNGGLSAYTGGKRWTWEQSVFDGAYDNAPNRLRPKYGALNFRNYATGGSPRFGSAFFQLKPHTLERTTFCYPDSSFEPECFAASERLNSLTETAYSSKTDLLDDYIEAHVHGVVSLKEDIECVVLDPVYRSSIVEGYAVKLGVPIKWHSGYELGIEQMNLYPDYRGQQFIDLAGEIAQDDKINARLLGLAVSEQGYYEQDVKKIWHYLARFGYLSTRA